MMIFSEVHNWQNAENVKQIRVFASGFTKRDFDAAYNTATNNGKDWLSVFNFSDNENGVAYKIRAVKDGDDNWIPLIRCGHTGHLIWEANRSESTWQAAMVVALCEFQKQITKSSDTYSTIEAIIKNMKAESV
jgi:hypothetical protein